jgi:hypothetical protein
MTIHSVSRSVPSHSERDASAAVMLVVLMLVLANIVLIGALASP